jgi:butyryl-CoA dehydrogenase
MDFNFNEMELDIINMLEDFCVNEVKPLAAELDEQERFPTETLEKLSEMGMMGMYIPEEYGGAGLSYNTYTAANETFNKYCASTGCMFEVHGSLVTWPLLTYGTEEQKQKYLPKMASGEMLGAFGLTEPGAGSDASGQKTTAVDNGDHWLLNGTKCFITNGYYASLYLVFAMTDKEKGTKGISAFLVEKGTPGFSFGTKEKKMGIHGTSTYELVFEDVKLPKDALLGKVGDGFKIAMSTLDGGRISIAAQGVGIAQGALNELIPVIKARKQFGRSIASFQNTQFKVAEMQTEIDAARLLVYRASQMKQDHKPCVKEAAMAKYYATKTANDVARMCLQLAGGIGFTREYPFERFMRDAKITEIYEGTNEIQRIIISGEMGIR